MQVGFILYHDREIPFALEGYRMEVFSNKPQDSAFIEEYNHKTDYKLQGIFMEGGNLKQSATFFVERSLGWTCYLRCYTRSMLPSETAYDSIGFQSPSLDGAFRYQYERLERIRSGQTIENGTVSVYKVPFEMDGSQYALDYRIGHDNRLGLLEDYKRDGEIIVQLQTREIKECYSLSIVLSRLASFMTSHSGAAFKRITLYQEGRKVGWFFCDTLSEKPDIGYEPFFFEFDVMHYIPKILSNIATDIGNKVTHSAPLGYLGDANTPFSPQRFMEQIIAFEYLFKKIDPRKAKDKNTPLQKELESMIDKYPETLGSTKKTAEEASKHIKEVRRNIVHGYAYYYDFKNDPEERYYMLLLDKLLKKMSLQVMGFLKEDIDKFPVV